MKIGRTNPGRTNSVRTNLGRTCNQGERSRYLPNHGPPFGSATSIHVLIRVCTIMTIESSELLKL